MSNARVEVRARGTEAVTGRMTRQVAAVLIAALATAIGARFAVPVPGLAVPVSLQSLAVVLTGALLGARLGAASQAAYLLAGALGAPVFAYGTFGLAYLFGPTGGYLLAFPLAAAVTGVLTAHDTLHARWPARLLRTGIAMIAGIAIIFAGGLAQLTLLTGDATQAVRVGLLPFLLGDALKAIVATAVAARIGARVRALF